MHRLSVKTASRVELRDITSQVVEKVQSSGARSGVCYVFVPHTTAAVILNEHADPDVARDIAAQLESVAPQHTRYLHAEGNAPAHVKTSLLGNSLMLFIEDGELVLGTWQGIFLCEFDGPRSRTVLVKIVPDAP